MTGGRHTRSQAAGQPVGTSQVTAQRWEVRGEFNCFVTLSAQGSCGQTRHRKTGPRPGIWPRSGHSGRLQSRGKHVGLWECYLPDVHRLVRVLTTFKHGVSQDTERDVPGWAPGFMETSAKWTCFLHHDASERAVHGEDCVPGGRLRIRSTLVVCN